MRWVFAENQGKNYGKNIKFNNFKMISKLLCGARARDGTIAYVENLVCENPFVSICLGPTLAKQVCSLGALGETRAGLVSHYS